MAGDVIFDKNLQRTINVDIRFVLWTIDKFAGARRIVDELKLVRDENTPADTGASKIKTATPTKKKKK